MCFRENNFYIHNETKQTTSKHVGNEVQDSYSMEKQKNYNLKVNIIYIIIWKKNQEPDSCVHLKHIYIYIYISILITVHNYVFSNSLN